MEKMTVTRALAELKLIDSRISSALNGKRFVDIYQNKSNVLLSTNETKENFTNKVKATLASVTDLIKRRDAIKRAILKSNAKTKVKINNVEFSVVEAIDRKNSIFYLETFRNQLASQYNTVLKEVNTDKAQLDLRVATMLEKNLGTDKKVSGDDYDLIAKPFIEANEKKIFDPSNIKDMIESMSFEIDTFKSEVDFVLSESNSKTEIEI